MRPALLLAISRFGTRLFYTKTMTTILVPTKKVLLLFQGVISAPRLLKRKGVHLSPWQYRIAFRTLANMDVVSIDIYLHNFRKQARLYTNSFPF